MDASGDGLPDLLFAPQLAGASVGSFVNLGDRFRFSDDVDGPANPVWPFEYLTHSVTSNAMSSNQGATITQGARAGEVFPLDFDGDGRLDLYWRVDLDGDGDDDGDQGRLFTGDGAGDVTDSVALGSDDRDGVRQYLDADNEFRVLRDYVDLNGDGSLDYVQQGTGEFIFEADAEVVAGKPPRLLHHVDNGRGGLTDVRYRASTDSAIDIPGTDDRLGMPTHNWVVETITTSDVSDSDSQTGMSTGVTTYRYGRPIFNRDRQPMEVVGRHGFRGFERVQVTSPLGGVTESVFDYTLDWSGRLVETSVYLDDDQLVAGTADSIEQTTWQAFTLFCPSNVQAALDPTFLYYYCAADPETLPAMSFQPVDQKSWTCSSGQTREDCLDSGALRVETTAWLGKAAEGDAAGLVLLYNPFELWRKQTDAIQEGDRLLRTRTFLYSGTDFYRVRPDREVTWEQTVTGIALRARRDHTWIADQAGRPGGFEERVGDLSEMAVSSAELRYNELNLGLVTGRKKPQQFHENGPRNTIAYDVYRVHVVSTTNEKGHVVETDHDLGTGALLAQRGPNSLPNGAGGTEYEGSRTVIDGFGRPLEVYAMTDDPVDGTYREILVQRNTYLDTTLPQTVIEERRIDWDAADFTKVETEFGGFGRLSKRIESRFEAGKVNPVSRFRYDAQGNLRRVTVRNPAVDTSATVAYQYLFDTLNRPIEIERPDGTRIEWTYDGLSKSRREVAGSGPEAETITTDDVFGRLVGVEERIDASTLATTLYAWDANDNLSRVESPDGIVTELMHDWMSRRTSIRRGERQWVYTYDRNGNMVAERTPVPDDDPMLYTEYTTTVAFDTLDRPTSRIIAPRELDSSILADLGLDAALEFDYDQGQNGLGRLTSTSNPIWTRTYLHDARGNVVEESFHFDLEPALGVAIEDTRTRTRTFNPLGGVVDEWHGDGTTLSASTHTTTTYSGRGLPKTLTWQQMTPVLLATATRNGAGLLKTLGAGQVSQTWTHDSIGRVTNMQAESTASAAPAIAETWAYYGADDPQTLATSRTGLATRNFTFSYDDRHQLQNAFDDAGYSADLGYTLGGRLLSADVASTSAPLAPPRNVNYEYPEPEDSDYELFDPEAVKALAPVSGGFSMEYGFDLAGNVTSRTEGGGSPDFTFLYDGEDQQRIATAANGDQELYYYDHNGQRILVVSRQSGGTVTKVHLWLGSLEVEYDGSNAVTQTLAHLSLEQPVARIENRNTAKRVVHGQLGHFLGAFTANNSALDVAFVYGPFGEILAQSGADPADYTQRFNGKEQDALTSLSYYGARYFDPQSLTWTQADPLYRFAPDAAWDDPRRANVYSFSLNNPLRYADPDGEDAVAVLGASCSAAPAACAAAATAAAPIVAVAAAVTWIAVVNKGAAEAGYTCNMTGHCMPALHFEAAPKPLQANVEDPNNPEPPSSPSAPDVKVPHDDPLRGNDPKKEKSESKGLTAKERRARDQARTAEEKAQGRHHGNMDQAHADQKGGDVEDLIDKEQGIKKAYPDQPAGKTRQRINEKLREQAQGDHKD